jgi:hypothetical protein
VLAGAKDDTEAPAIKAAIKAANDAGYDASAGDCDMGARRAIGLPEDPNVYTVSVYFTTRADAEQALQLFHAHGYSQGAVAEVETYCSD